MDAELGRERRPERGTHHRDPVPSRDERRGGRADRPDGRVVVPGRRWADLAAVTLRELLIQEGVVKALPLLPNANTPGCRAYRVDNERARPPIDPPTPLQKREVEVTVFAPGRGVSLVEPTDGLEDFSP